MPFVTSNAAPVGTAFLGDWRLTRLYVRQESRLDVDTAGELFDRFEMKLRAEQRANFAVIRPQAIARVDLTAA